MEWEDKFKSNLLEVLYRADQPRDEKGRWTSGGAGAGSVEDSKVYNWALNKFGDAQTAKNFTEWFGDSKVVDVDGNPMVVYHGGQTDITDFSFGATRGLSGLAYFSDAEVASMYAMGGGIDTDLTMTDYIERTVDNEIPGRVTPVYLTITNPLTDSITFGEIVDEIGEQKIKTHLENVSTSMAEMFDGYQGGIVDILESEDWPQWIAGEDSLAFSNSNTLSFLYGTGLISEFMETRDGMIYDDAETGGKTYVVFKPTQIKSATGNVGAFDPNNPNITLSNEE